MEQEIYRGFKIYYDPPPIPIRSLDWLFVHEDYDGPEDSRFGHCASLEECKSEIDDMLYELGHDRCDKQT